MNPRRHPGILGILLIGLLGLARGRPGVQPAIGAPAADAARVVTILHTNDLHGHLTPWQGWEGTLRGQRVGGFARLAAEVRRVRSERGDGGVLLLDAGDTIGDSMLAAETKGLAVVEAMNALRYDAMVIGNHEPDFGENVLRARLGDARFSMLAANVVTGRGEPITRPSIVRSVNGITVGIIGLAYPNTPLTSARRNVEHLRFEDAAEAARQYVPRLRREGASIVVALTHLGLGADKQLASQVPGIDVIVGGHSHNRMAEAVRVGTTLIVQAGAHGSDLGRLDLRVEGGRITAHCRHLIPLTTPSSPSAALHDDATRGLITRLRAPFAAQLDARIGRAAGLIARAQTLAGQEPEARDAESPADDLFADAMRETTGTEIAFLPGLGYGVAIPPGDINAEQLRNLIPHDSGVWTMRLTGAQVREVLEQAVENFSAEDAAKKVGGIVQVSGLRFTYDPRQARGSRVLEVTAGGRPIRADRSYSVTTNALMAEGGHNYHTFTEAAERRQLEGTDQYAMVRAWIVRRGTIAAPVLDRIIKVTNDQRQ